MRLRFLALIACLSTGCQTIRPEAAAVCSLPAYPLELREVQAQLAIEGSKPSEDVREAVLGDLLTEMTTKAIQQPALVNPLFQQHRKVLLLSGGSQHGAFGAGFIAGLAKGTERIADYDVVTGISVGATQAPAVFLANRAPSGRDYPPYMKRPSTIGTAGTSNPIDLALAFSLDRESSFLKKRRLGYADLVFKGSLATFEPMRSMLMRVYSSDTVRQIRENSKDRLLLVGATNLDDGKTYAFDLTQLANDPGSDAAKVPCLVDAMLASATVPPGVPPISLKTHPMLKDNNPAPGAPSTRPGESTVHPFIDGGSRYAVFFSQLAGLENGRPNRATIAQISTDVDVIVNGGLFLPLWIDPKQVNWNQQPPKAPEWDAKFLRKTYSIYDVAMRSLAILESQARETSLQSALDSSRLGKFRLAYISERHLKKMELRPGLHRFPRDTGQTCDQWHEYDRKMLHPLEFYPDYMRCLVDYGQERGETEPWNDEHGPAHPLAVAR